MPEKRSGSAASGTKESETGAAVHQPSTERRRCLVVLFRDFEAFSPEDVSEFVSICSEYRDTLPIFLVLGIASTPDVIHK